MDQVLIPLAGMLIPIVIVPTALGLKHARYLREVEHVERMKAMELGRTLAEDESWSPTNLAAGIGVGVPLGSLLLAWMASSLSASAAEPISVAVGIIGLGGLICGTILASRLIATRHQPFPAPSEALKSQYDPDAYDVVGRRG